MMPVFLDTVGLIALWDRDDQWHAAAETAYRNMVAKQQAAVTTIRALPDFVMLFFSALQIQRLCERKV